MKIVYLLAYPIYHEQGSLAGTATRQQPLAGTWLDVENQNRWIPGVLGEMGHEVEYWIGDHASDLRTSRMEGFPDYPIRVFACDPVDRRTKYHVSYALVEHARHAQPDLVLIKGIDGGLGTHLIEQWLLPERRPFVLVTGGKFYTRHVHEADAVVYETAYQREQLVRPRGLRRIWQRPVEADKLIPMPKSVDTDRFRPLPDVEQRYDVVVVGRLHRRQKSFAEAGLLSEHLRVAVAGSGPEEARLRAQYPRIDWLGHVPNRDLPTFLNSGRLFLHPAAHDRRPTRDFFPRVIAEAFACGVPSVGFADLIAPDVLPDACGLRVPRDGYLGPIQSLLRDEERRQAMSTHAREHAVEYLGKRSSAPAMRSVLDRVAVVESTG